VHGAVGLIGVVCERQCEHSVKCVDAGQARVTGVSQNYVFKQNAFKNGQGIARILRLYWEDNRVYLYESLNQLIGQKNKWRCKQLFLDLERTKL
jgi:hypothetical protein